MEQTIYTAFQFYVRVSENDQNPARLEADDEGSGIHASFSSKN